MPSIHRIRAASLTGYAELARSAGLDVGRMLRAVGLEPSCLLDPDRRIAAQAVDALLERSARLSGVEAFGLRLAETRHLSNLGPIGLLVREAPNARDAISALVHYMHLHNEALSIDVENDDDLTLIRLEFLSGQHGESRQGVELCLGVLMRILKMLLGPKWQPQSASFAHRRPIDLAVHRRVFGRCVDFGQSFNAVACRAADLDAPLPMTDPLLARYARQYLDSIGAAGDAGMIERVRRLIRLLLPSGRCTIDLVARQLGINRRTIHRRLARDGETYSGLMTDARKEFALRYVANQDRPLLEIAELLGFSTLSVFSRWFRIQFGCCATEWRTRGSKQSSARHKARHASGLLRSDRH